MLTAFANSLKVPELRAKIIFTLIVVIIVRIGAQVTTPGVNAWVLHQWFLNQVDNQSTGSVAALFNIFSGGALENCAIFSLGIMPYISASIMLQLMGSVIPQLSKMQKEDGGRQKISQYTRYATVILCIIQGYLLARSFENPQSNVFLPGIMTTIHNYGVDLVPFKGPGFEFITVMSLTAGTMLLMWLGDQITERGIGNGISLIITIGIVARLPAALIQAWHTFVPSNGNASQVNPIVLLFLLVFFVFVVGSIIALTQAQRKISVQYARRVVGRKEYRGGTQSLPLKLNYAGVMPIIFGQAILLFPSSIINMVWKTSPTAQALAQNLTSGWMHYVLYALMIFFFSYFLGGDDVPAQPDRRGTQKERRLHSRGASRQADGGLPRFHDDTSDVRGRDLPCHRGDVAAVAGAPDERAVRHCAVLRRHESAHYCGRDPRHDAPDRDPSHSAPLRRVPAQREDPWALRRAQPRQAGRTGPAEHGGHAVRRGGVAVDLRAGLFLESLSVI